MTDFRHFKAFTDPNFFRVSKFTTTNSTDNELWALLKMPSKVTDMEFDIVSEHGPIDESLRPFIIKRYTGFIAQAEANWKAAKQGDFHSTPLLYYYCFLNLVKAELVLSDHLLRERIGHGISTSNARLPENFANAVVKTSSGVFSKYYKSIYDSDPLPAYTVEEMISYLQEMTLQLQLGRFTAPKAISYRCRLVVNDDSCWAIFVIPKTANLGQFSKLYPDFFKHFEKVEITENMNAVYTEAIGAPYMEWKGFDFYQSKEPAVKSDRQSLTNFLIELEFVIKKHSSVNLYNNDDTAIMNLPQDGNTLFRFNEELAIYSFMFLLSSIVRYNPSYFSAVLDSKYGFLIEGFVESSPERFLKYIVNRIYKRNFIFVSS